MNKLKLAIGTFALFATAFVVKPCKEANAAVEYAGVVKEDTDNYADPDYWKYLARENKLAIADAASDGKVKELYGLNVVEKPVFLNSTEFRNTTKSFLTNKTYTHDEAFSDRVILDGIDVSTYQGDVNWNKVKEAGIDFVIIRAGFRSMSDGKIYLDGRLYEYLDGVKAAGIEHVGVYFFSQAISVKEGQEEAQFVIDALRNYEIDMPIIMDVENATGKGRYIEANISKSQRTQICNAFCERVVDYGYKSMIYTGTYFMNDYLVESNLNCDRIWMAQYTSKFSRYNGYGNILFKGDYEMWQYACTGNVSGIAYNVDCDFWYYDEMYDYNGIIPTSLKLTETYVGLKSGNYHKLTPQLLPSSSNAKIKWTSEDPAVAYVTDGGKVTGCKGGETYIVATTKNGLSARCKVRVYDTIDDYGCTTITDATYTGKNILKKFTVVSKEKIPYRGVVASDYLIMRKGVGVSFNAIATLEKDDSFKILKKVIYQDRIWYAIDFIDAGGIEHRGYVCGGKSGSDYIILYESMRIIREGMEYTISYKDNKKIGTATIEIEGIKDNFFLGTLKRTFTIKPEKVVNAKLTKRGYISNEIGWDKVSCTTAYEIYRSESYDGQYKKIANVSGNYNTFLDKNLKSGKCYYYKIRAVKKCETDYIYGNYSSILTTRTARKKVIEATVDRKTFIFSGAGIKYSKLYTFVGNEKINNLIAVTLDEYGNEWYYINYTDKGKVYKGYIKANYIVGYKKPGTTKPSTTTPQSSVKKGKVNISSETLNFRKAPSLTAEILWGLEKGTVVEILDESNGWCKVKVKINGVSMTGYVSSQYIVKL